MATESSYDMRPIKAKLRDYASVNPSAMRHEVAFAETLVHYMNDDMVVGGSVLAARLLLADLTRGKSGYSNVALPPCLVGLPSMVYAMFDMGMPDMMTRVSDETFGAVFSAAWEAR